MAADATAKAGIEGLTRSPARDFGPDGIRMCTSQTWVVDGGWI